MSPSTDQGCSPGDNDPCLAYCINDISRPWGPAVHHIRHQGVDDRGNAPVITFLTGALISFFTGTSWGPTLSSRPSCFPALNLRGPSTAWSSHGRSHRGWGCSGTTVLPSLTRRASRPSGRLRPHDHVMTQCLRLDCGGSCNSAVPGDRFHGVDLERVKNRF